MDDYIFPFEMKYNREYLFDTVQKIVHWPAYADPNIAFRTAHRDILFPIDMEAIKIKNSLLTSTTYSFSVVPPGHETGWHTDKNRGCTLILPINPEPHLIKFQIDGNTVDYYYDGPVITNAKTIHNGINHTNVNRYNLLFHFDLSYHEVKNLIETNNLIDTWKQTYDIAVCYNSPMMKEYYNSNSDVDNSKIIITDDIELADIYSAYHDKFIIFIGNSNGKYVDVIGKNDSELIKVIKFILDCPFKIKSITLE